MVRSFDDAESRAGQFHHDGSEQGQVREIVARALEEEQRDRHAREVFGALHGRGGPSATGVEADLSPRVASAAAPERPARRDPAPAPSPADPASAYASAPAPSSR